MALMGDPDAPDNFSGIIIRVKFLLLNLLKLQRFSTINISLDNSNLCTGKLLSEPLSMLGESIHTAFTFLSTRYFAAPSERPGL
jgi:hypothetical protein